MSSDSPSDDTRKVAELLKGSRLAMFTTIAADGTLISRPMALQEVEFDGDLWFFAEHTSRKVAHLAGDPQVNITVGSGSTWVSLTGTGSSVQDVQKQKDLWNAGVEAWFPQGPDSGDLVLIRVEANSAEYWDTPGGRVATLLSFAKAKATGQRYSGGENQSVQL